MAIKLSNITIDAKDSKALAAFYAELLGGAISEVYGCQFVSVSDNPADPGYLFVQEDDYVPPVWPEEDGKQQKSIHLDFVTGANDYKESIAKALTLGASLASLQESPEDFTVLIDPEGHPFCLCRMSL